jgi:hypothetical protein
MDKESINEDRRKRQAFERLGTDHPQCVICGESDWRCLEVHHVAGKGYTDDVAILCRNCHRKLSDPSENGPSPSNLPLMAQIGQWLVGLGDYFIELGRKLKERGNQLLEGALVCPWPWGWQTPQPEGV